MQIADLTDEELFALCSEVHSRIFKGFRYTYDKDKFGVTEYWDVPENLDRVVDDCDGFAMACRVALTEKEIPNRLIYCKTETGEGHLVCAVGNFILDNRYPKVKTKFELDNAGYEWIATSGFKRGDPWRQILN